MSATARPYHHGNLRAALLARAEEVLRDEGAAALSLRELARDVGVSHGAPRRHFPDKQSLLDALAIEGFDRLAGALEGAVVEDDGGAFGDRVAAMARAFVHFATAQPALLGVMFAAKHGPKEELHAASARAFATTRALIAEGQAAGELAEGDPEVFARALFALLQGVVALANGGMLPADEVDATVTDGVERLLRGSRPQ